MNFRDFARHVRDRFNSLTSDKTQEVFRVDLSGDDLWDTYLRSFPEGTNPKFRERTEHDCSCCRSFIRGVGGLVTIDSRNQIHTIWDDPGSDPTYKIVAEALAERVRSSQIGGLFRATETRYGVEFNHEKKPGMPEITWHHFNCEIPSHLFNKDPGIKLSEATSAHQVFSRGIQEFTPEILGNVLDLINSDSLYRGEEHKKAVQGFLDLRTAWDLLPQKDREAFIWRNVFHPSSRIRNTVIGTLCQDIAEGMDVEKAVGRFEAKVAPENYKRSSAPITKGMIDNALLTLRNLGLEDSLQRRFATIRDVSPSNVLFVDRGSRPLMKDPLADLLMAEIKPKARKSSPNAEKDAVGITCEEFLRDVIPGAESVGLHFERSHIANLMSITAPVHPDSGRLFQWDNPFAWCYTGGNADSAMRKAVQEKGGRVDGVFRFTHSWNHPGQRNSSLMDLHVFMPGNGTRPDNGVHDYYGKHERVGWNHRNHARSGGVQDVDYTEEAPEGYIPVENITFPDLHRMPEGQYICKVHNWRLRSPNKGGFRAEIEVGGNLYEYEYNEPLNNKQWITVAVVTLKKGVFTIEHKLESKTRQVEKWGVKTQTVIPVETIMLSPNYWDGEGSGNKHYLFTLRDCKNPDPIRGFFNEFLRSDLVPHRKVFEILASKTQCTPSDDQLSGVGFSSTQKNSAVFTVRKDGSTRTYNVQF